MLRKIQNDKFEYFTIIKLNLRVLSILTLNLQNIHSYHTIHDAFNINLYIKCNLLHGTSFSPITG